MRVRLFLLLLVLFPAFLQAQEKDSLVACKYYINGHFFTFQPMTTEHEDLYFIQGPNGKIIYQDSPTKLSERDLRYAVDSTRVKNAAAIIETIRENKKRTKVRFIPSGRCALKEGDRLPAFTVKDLEGNTYTNASTKGRLLVLNFWYTGCGPCIREMPLISKWIDRYPNATYLAVTSNTARQIKPIIKRKHFRFHQIAADKQLFKIFNVQDFPITVVIDANGVIRLLMYGTNEEKRDLIEEKIKEFYQ